MDYGTLAGLSVGDLRGEVSAQLGWPGNARNAVCNTTTTSSDNAPILLSTGHLE